MAPVRWNPQGLQSLVQHDAWRFSHGWEPIASELMESVTSYFHPQVPDEPPRFMPGRVVILPGEPTDLRMITVRVRSKPFRVYFRYREELQAFEIVLIQHPRAKMR